jgi:hypothetical protein
MSTEIKVFKLVNGDEIIGNIIDSNDSIFKINNPMIFRTSTVMDNRGYPYDVTILKDWMIRSDDKIAEIHKNQVSLIFSPNEKTIKLYNLELDRMENSPEEQIVNADGPDSPFESTPENDLTNMLDDFMDEIHGIMQDNQKHNQKKKKRKKLPKVDEVSFESMIPDELKKRPMIYLSMVIPPEAIMNLMTAGILDPEQLLGMIKEIKKANKFTGDEKKRKDFGNKFSDWNPDPESPDY